MVQLSVLARGRLLAAARAELGPAGEQRVREATARGLSTTLEQLTYRHLPALFRAVEQAPAAQSGSFDAFAAALRSLQRPAARDYPRETLAAMTALAGVAAEPMLRRACASCGLSIEKIDRTRLTDVADSVRNDATGMFGDEIAGLLAGAISALATDQPERASPQVRELAREHLGANGEATVERLAREHLHLSLDELTTVHLSALADSCRTATAVEVDSERVRGFGRAAWMAITKPSAPLRERVLQIVVAAIGPFGADFVKDACKSHGLPFDGLDEDLLVWFTDMIYEEARAFASADVSERLRNTLRGFTRSRAA